jgi:hypothetical protein
MLMHLQRGVSCSAGKVMGVIVLKRKMFGPWLGEKVVACCDTGSKINMDNLLSSWETFQSLSHA